MNYLCRSLNATDASEEGIIIYASDTGTTNIRRFQGDFDGTQLPFPFLTFGLKISSFTRWCLTNSFIRILQQQTLTRHNGYPSSSFHSPSYLRFVLRSSDFRKCINWEGKYFCCTEYSSNESFSFIQSEDRLSEVKRDMRALHAHSTGRIDLDYSDMKAMASNVENSKEELGELVFA